MLDGVPSFSLQDSHGSAPASLRRRATRSLAIAWGLPFVTLLMACHVERKWPEEADFDDQGLCEPFGIEESWSGDEVEVNADEAYVSACAPRGAPAALRMWLAPSDGRYRIFVPDGQANGDPSISLFDAACQNEELLCQADVGGIGEMRSLAASVEFDALAGQEFVVGIANTHPDGAETEFDVRIGDAPSCDLWSDAGEQLVRKLPQKPSLASHPLCASDGPEVLVRWRAPEEGIYEFSSKGSSVETSVFLFSPLDDPDGEGLTCLGNILDCVSDGPLGKTGQASAQGVLSRELTRDEEVTVLVDAAQADATGDIRLAVKPLSCEPLALTVTDEASGTLGAETSFFNATDFFRVTGDSACRRSNDGNYTPDLAFVWTPSAPGKYIVSAFDGSDQLAQRVRIYQLTDVCSTRECVAAIDDSTGLITVVSSAPVILIVEALVAEMLEVDPDLRLEVRPFEN
jgi:hypothetical protein